MLDFLRNTSSSYSLAVKSRFCLVASWYFQRKEREKTKFEFLLSYASLSYCLEVLAQRRLVNYA